jgi:hypothetical protein
MNALYLQIEQYIEDFRRNLLQDIQKIVKESTGYQAPNAKDTPQWVSGAQAKELLSIKSRNAMKKVRASGIVHFTKPGREYLYELNSLNDYLLQKSTFRLVLHRASKKAYK